MSYSHSKPAPIGEVMNQFADWNSKVDSQLPFVQSADVAIDAALRDVPLPEGMLTRLKRVVLAMPEGPVSHPMDYLGC